MLRFIMEARRAALSTTSITPMKVVELVAPVVVEMSSRVMLDLSGV